MATTTIDDLSNSAFGEEAPAPVVVLVAVGTSPRVTVMDVRGTLELGRTAEIDDERMSREHASVRFERGAWVITDRGSRNGTFVDGARVQGRMPLPGRHLLKIGDVAMWFLAEVLHEPVAPPSMATASVGGGLVRFQIAPGALELCLVGTTDPAAGGALLSRAGDADRWTEKALAPLEYQLLRTLCVRATEEKESPSAVRGCVATKQLARDLPFQSKYANEENVRQVVRRVRHYLGELGVESALAVAPGRGYYIACPVSVASADRR